MKCIGFFYLFNMVFSVRN